MSFPTSGVTDKWGRPTFSETVPAETFEKYADRVPGFLLDLWRDLGFAGFQKGLLWLCDPEKWQDAVDEWTSGIEFPFGDDSWVAVTRSAFGDMKLWGQRTGLSLTVIPYQGWIVPNDKSHKMAAPFDRDVQIYASLLAASRDTLDLTGEDDKPLFKRAMKRLGSIGPNTMYGFVPAAALGGPMLPEHIEIVDASVHMQMLSQVTDRVLLVDNPYK